MANANIHIKKEMPELGVTVNSFGDTADEAFQRLLNAIELCTGDAELPRHPQRPTEAHRARAREEALAGVAAPAGDQPKPRPRGNGGSSASPVPICQGCGVADEVELITFTDRDTGDPLKRFKCQACKTWVGKAF